MKLYLISDNADTLTGMRLSGVEGELARTKEELIRALDRAVEDPSIAILLLTERFSVDYPEIVNARKLSVRTPLIIDIPDRHGSGRRPDFITSYVEEAIGLKL